MRYLLVISGGMAWAGRGAKKSVHDSEEEALSTLAEYVRQDWDREMDGAPMPEETEQRVAEYFEASGLRYEVLEFEDPSTSGKRPDSLHWKERS